MSTAAEKFYGKLSFLWKNLNSAGDESADIAAAFLAALAGEGDDTELPPPFSGAVAVVHEEYDRAAASNRGEAFELLENLIDDGADSEEKLAEALWAALFPEALHLDTDPDEQIPLLRKSRIISAVQPVPDPITDPAGEILFTSNVLLSPPLGEVRDPGVPEEIAGVIAGAADAAAEPQLYWYDHPIAVGTPEESDEAVYGLCGLADALRYEKNRGNAGPESRLKVLLSVSVTHAGLHEWALPWLRAQISRTDPDRLDGLDVFAFTEKDSSRVVDLIAPWLGSSGEADIMRNSFGVDGEYGRHYSFLKALPALWAVLADDELKATFKTDLDQVFPQEELCAETGMSAFEHLKTPLWGALGVDVDGQKVELGMIAGALVNEKDIAAGLFTPDIAWPAELPEGENLLFFKHRPMAVSTRAELMTRYGTAGSPDGEKTALQRIHVTGGTNGIRFDALRRHRPFTPSFIGRAEDQGYILSVLSGAKDDARLRYAHASGLFMRHDKEAFAGAAIKAGKAGSYVGDLVRTFVFSHYAGFLPGGMDAVKKTVDPFTGCFITPLPATLALLRLALHLLTVEGGSSEDRFSLMKLAGDRLTAWIGGGSEKVGELEDRWNTERRAWDGFYSAIERLEKDIADNRSPARDTRDAFRVLLSECKISG